MDQPSPARGWRHGRGERGWLSPKDRIPYHTANRPPVSNQRLPEILDGPHPPGGSWQDTGRRHPTSAVGNWGWGRRGQKAHAPESMGGNRDWDGGEEKAHHTRGECPCQAPGCLSHSDGEGTKSRCSFLFRAFVEHRRAGTAPSTGHTPNSTAESLSSLEGKAARAPPHSARN